MKTTTIILFFIMSIQLNAQTIDRDFIVKWITSADSTFDVHSVITYRIDRKSYYTTDIDTLNNRLLQISVNQLKSIFFSKVKACNYVPGKGTIYIQTIQRQNTDDVEGWLIKAKELFIDYYTSLSQETLLEAKDPVLVIDSKLVHYTEAKQAIRRIEPKDIFDIDISHSPVPSSIYGTNAKNGLVQIWTINYLQTD